MITRQEFEKSLLDIGTGNGFDYYSASKEEIESMLGSTVARMIGFEQKNAHHCYDLWEHTLHTVESAGTWEEYSEDDKMALKISAFFHDIAKPDVARMNERTGQQNFYDHAERSGGVAQPILEELGYSEDEINRLRFLIEHHDDFISYRYQIPEYLEHHEFIRQVTPVTLAEKIIENRFDFKAMGYNTDQIRAITYELARGEKPSFQTQDGIKEIDVDMDEVKSKMTQTEFSAKHIPSLEDYRMLIDLCKSDANAQSEKAIMNDRVVGTRFGKIAKMGNVEDAIEEAYKIAEYCIDGKDRTLVEAEKEKYRQKILAKTKAKGQMTGQKREQRDSLRKQEQVKETTQENNKEETQI